MKTLFKMFNKVNTVSWKVFSDDARQSLDVYRNGVKGVGISANEYYTGDKGRIVIKEVMLSLDEHQVRELHKALGDFIEETKDLTELECNTFGRR